MTSYINDRGKTPSTGDVVGPASATDNAVARFDGTGGKTLQNSSFVVDDSGHVTSFGGQIAFPATQAASAGANVLDDYEEGTWTPVDGSPATLSFSNVAGHYTKVGNKVFITGRADYPATADTNIAKIGGLPFTTSSDGGKTALGWIGYSNNATVQTALFLSDTTSNTYYAFYTSVAGIQNTTIASSINRFAGQYLL